MLRQYSHEEIAEIIENQLASWPLARKNYDALSSVERRSVDVGGFDFYLQFNPARIVSTGASVDKSNLAARPCFLCAANRPKEQTALEIFPGWELLVNPYPIFPVHFTIASVSHQPQAFLPKEIVEIALLLPGMAVFFNGAKAGASAPDHLHMQAVLKDELPLIRLVEKKHPESVSAVLPSDAFLPGFPFLFFSGVVEPGEKGMKALMAGLYMGGSSSGESFTDHELVNTFFWLGEGGKLRFIAIPRKAHRPACYSADGPERRMVSPGCVDMASLLILPRKEDYDNITPLEIARIYEEVAFKPRRYEK